MSWNAILLAVCPVVLLLGYVLYADRHSPEPGRVLLKTLFYGFLTIPIALLLATIFQLLGLYAQEPESFGGAVAISFWGAAIPEEIAKFLMLWLLLRKNPHFDERMDGVLYAVIISMGFAVIENILYLSDAHDYLDVGITRAIFSIPGHFGFGVLMGYFYSKATFGLSQHRRRNMLFALLLPILAHGIYDALLFVQESTPALSAFCNLTFLCFCLALWWHSKKRIRDLSNLAQEHAQEPSQEPAQNHFVPAGSLPEGTLFYILFEGQIFGPFTLDKLREYPLLEDTMVTTNTLRGEWHEAREFECLDDLLK